MAGLDELRSLIPVDQIAARLGVDTATAQQGIDAALPALLGGLDANAKDPAGAASLSGAVAGKDSTLLDGGVDVDAIDTGDGEKIVRNVFGEKTEDVAQALGATPGAQDTGLVKKLLPILAPIVMAYLAQRVTGKGDKPSAGGGIKDLLGSLLGGGTSSGAGGVLGGLLGGLLGGGKR